MKFIGRHEELKILKTHLLNKDRRLVAIVGRRGSGKTRLNDEFKIRCLNEEHILFEFKGRKNEKKQNQIANALNEIDYVISKKKISVALLKTEKKKIIDNGWFGFFNYFLEQIKLLRNNNINNKIIVLIDEFSWLNNHLSNFIDEFGIFYDKVIKENILFVITGSAVSWMNRNVLKTSGGLHSRVHETIQLKPFSLKETIEYLKILDSSLNYMDYINYYFYTGGIPRYLEKINTSFNLIENIKKIYENKSDAEQSEFNEMFVGIFESKSNIHRDIIKEYKIGNKKTKMELAKSLKQSYNTISKAVDDLVVSNILTEKQHYGREKKDSIYFLTDLFCFFYIKLFDKKIINYEEVNNFQLKGLAFEILTFLNVDLIKEEIGRSGFKTKEYSWSSHKAQIDLVLDYGKERFSLIETKFHQTIFDVDFDYTNNILNKKQCFLNSVSKINKEMDIIFFSLLGTKNKDGRLNYIDLSLKEIIEKMI